MTSHIIYLLQILHIQIPTLAVKQNKVPKPRGRLELGCRFFDLLQADNLKPTEQSTQGHVRKRCGDDDKRARQ
jgi:hypothetical protein